MEAIAGLAAFSIACNVMQTIHFSLEACAACKRVWRGKSPAPELDDHRATVQKAALDLQQSLRTSSQSTGQLQEAELRKTAGEIIKVAKKLERVLNDCKTSAFKYVAVKRHKINKLSETLRGLQKNMELGILINLRYLSKSVLKVTSAELHRGKVESHRALFEQRLGNIDQETQNFVRQLQSGNTRLEKLIDRASGQIRPLIEQEGEKSRAHLTTHTETIRNFVVGEFSDTRDHFTSTMDNYRSTEVHAGQVEVLLSSLRYQEMYARRNASAINNNHEGTYQWIFEDYQQRRWDNFGAWLRSDEKIYWISGKAGSGKSSLIRQLVDDDRTVSYLRQWRTDAKVVSAFIWNAGSTMQRSQVGVLATLVHQLLSRDELAAANFLREKKFMKTKRNLSDWSKTELLQTLKALCNSSSIAACFFIDGLDEIDSKEHDGAFGLLDTLEDLTSLHSVKMCLGSREEPVFVARLRACPRLRLQDLTRVDIHKYVEHALDNNVKLSSFTPRTAEELHKLANAVVERADGVFLWVHLVSKSIRDGLLCCDDWDSLTHHINCLPQDLSGLYIDMFKRLTGYNQRLYRAETALYFNLVLGERRGLSMFKAVLMSKPSVLRSFLSGGNQIQENYVFQQCQVARQRILAKCVGLLEVPELPDVDDGQSILNVYVSFMHRSVRDFLKDTQEGQKILSYDLRSPAERKSTSWLASMVESVYTVKAEGDGSEVIFDSLFDLSLLRESDTSVWVQTSLELPLLDVASSFLRRQFPTTVIDNAMLEFAAMTGSEQFLARFMQSLPPGCSPDLQRWRSKILSYAIDNPLHGLGRSLSLLFASDQSLGKQASLITWLLHEGADPNFLPPAINFSPVLSGAYQTPFIMFLQHLRNCLVRGNVVSSVSVNTWMKLACAFLEYGADTDSRSLQQVKVHELVRFGSLEGWPRPEWMRITNKYLTFILEMGVCQMFRGVEKKLEDWIERCDQPEPGKKRLRQILEDGNTKPEQVVLLGRGGNHGVHKYFSMASDLPNEQVVKESWAKSLPFSVVQVNPVTTLVYLGYLPQEAATQGRVDDILGYNNSMFYGANKHDSSGTDWSYKPEYDNFLEAVKRLESSTT